MAVHHHTLRISTRGPGLYEFTSHAARELGRSGLRRGMFTAFSRHTSCSLMIMENADPSARRDLVAWLDRLVPDNDPHFTHTAEGPDDMPSHIKMALTRTSESVPFDDGQLLLGTWQGLFLWEHRRASHEREVLLTFVGE